MHWGGGLHVEQTFQEPLGIGDLQQIGAEFFRVVAQKACMGADLAEDPTDGGEGSRGQCLAPVQW